MNYNPLAGPVIALVAWTAVMMIWMMVARFPVVKGCTFPDGARGADIEAGPHNWPAHNYAHLVEQPTAFYAIVFALIVMADQSAASLYLAWAYVVLRVVHSIWQATKKKQNPRFMLFLLSSLCLIALTVRAILLFLGQ